MAAKPLSAAGCEQDALNLCHDAIIHPATICRKKKERGLLPLSKRFNPNDEKLNQKFCPEHFLVLVL
jgi:hypothetical protein